MTEYQKNIVAIYQWACKQGIVRSKIDFAKQVKTDYAALVSAMNGNPRVVGIQINKRVQAWKDSLLADEIPEEQYPLYCQIAKDILCAYVQRAPNASEKELVDKSVFMAKTLMRTLARK